MIEIHGISKIYKKKYALHPVDLHVQQGDCVVLCGGNGAGKSTMIKILTGIERPSSGNVVFHTEKKKTFAYMPDNMNFPPELTPVEILSYYGKFLNVTKTRIGEVLKEVGLWEERNQRVGGFSKGMGQRLNLAQCLLVDTDIYIFDEPTNGLDPYWVIQFKEVIYALKQKRKTIIISSHIMRDAVEIADKVLILFNGQVKAFGPLDDIYLQNQCQSLEEVFLKIHNNENIPITDNSLNERKLAQ